MSAPSRLTNRQLRAAAHNAIERELGAVELARYLRENTGGSGNYVEDRRGWLPMFESVDQLWAEIASAREAGLLPGLGPADRKADE